LLGHSNRLVCELLDGSERASLLTRKAAEILGPDFDVEVVEMHHRMKKDAPSGTAATLVEILKAARHKQLGAAIQQKHGPKAFLGSAPLLEIGVHRCEAETWLGTIPWSSPGWASGLS